MVQTTTKPRNTWVTDKLHKTTRALAEEKTAHKQTRDSLKEAQDIIAVQTTELLELNKRLKDYQARYEKECYNVTLNGDTVTGITQLPAYRTYLPLHGVNGYDMVDITDKVKSSLYQRNPALQFLELHDRQLTINEIKYKKYKGALI